MATILKKLPDVIGFYLPGDRRHDWTGEIPDPKTGELVKEPSMTKQSFVPECDINNIVRDFTHQGVVTHINEKAAQGAFLDLPDQIDYQASIEIARVAQAAFDALPAQVRKRFDNDPAVFLAFMDDPKNQDEAIELGLATRRPASASSSSSSSSSSSAPDKAPDQAPDQAPKPPPQKA